MIDKGGVECIFQNRIPLDSGGYGLIRLNFVSLCWILSDSVGFSLFFDCLVCSFLAIFENPLNHRP